MPGTGGEMMRAALKALGGRAAEPGSGRPGSRGQPVPLLQSCRRPALPAADRGRPGLPGQVNCFFVSEGQPLGPLRGPASCPRVTRMRVAVRYRSTTGFRLRSRGRGGSRTLQQRLRTALSRQWLPTTNRLVNIWFPPVTSNPEELRDRVMWFKATYHCICSHVVQRLHAGNRRARARGAAGLQLPSSGAGRERPACSRLVILRKHRATLLQLQAQSSSIVVAEAGSSLGPGRNHARRPLGRQNAGAHPKAHSGPPA